MGPGERVGLGQRLLTLKIQEMSDLHRPATDHFIQINSGHQWQKRDASGDWVSLEPEELITDENTSDQPRYYRALVRWDTTKDVAGHNGEHWVGVSAIDWRFAPSPDALPTLRIERKDNAGNWSHWYQWSFPTACADVRNLLLTDVTTSAGNPDCFAFDPENADDALIHSLRSQRLFLPSELAGGERGHYFNILDEAGMDANQVRLISAPPARLFANRRRPRSLPQ